MEQEKKFNFKCVLHGSFRKHFDEIRKIHKFFTENGIEVLAPAMSEIKSIEDGFAVLQRDEEKDQRMIELLYLHNLRRLGEGGFSYFVNPEGYIGKSTSYELGIAQISNVPCFFAEQISDHSAYTHANSVWKPELLVEYINNFGYLPMPRVKRNEKIIHQLWEELILPGSVVSAGGIVEYESGKFNGEKEILLVKTYKWGGIYSIVGEKVRRNEKLSSALLRKIKEETGLTGQIGRHICTFDQIENSGYYVPGVQKVFVDNVVKVRSKKVKLNDEAEEYIWLPAREALQSLPIEPNARHTLQIYAEIA